jgi:hypothetical protein
MPYLFFFEWLAPLVVIFGIAFSIAAAVFGFLDWTSQVWLLLLVLLLATLGSVISILLDEISFTAYELSAIGPLFLATLLENFGYRQFVLVSNFMGLMAWLFQRPARGTAKYPGPFVKAWMPKLKDEA